MFRCQPYTGLSVLKYFCVIRLPASSQGFQKLSTPSANSSCETAFCSIHSTNNPHLNHLQLGKPLNCMSVARQPGAAGLVAAVGGAQMLKIVSISPHGLVEKTNLRLTNKVTSEVNFSIHDVEW